MPRHTVLSTKKLSPSLIEAAGKNDIEIIELEFIEIKRIWSEEKFQEIARFFHHEYVVFTSANAVTLVHDYLLTMDTLRPLPWKIFTLAGKTKDLLLNNSLFSKNIVEEAANATILAQKIIEYGVKEIVFFCGNKRRDELPFILRNAGVTVHEVIIYETVETPASITEKVDAVLFFSPSAVQSFFSVNQLKKDAICFSIGDTTAAAIKEHSTNKIMVSKAPSQAAVLQQVTDYFKNTIDI